GDVRQGRLYYLRGKVGREARIRERRRLVQEAAESEEPEAVADGTAEETAEES
ncbi:MAG: 50S ribosomal protein L19, partial [Gammaproteobacteria bacterium]|nr:50S ribosomal protein L19 [Gammaproteobacteria bacterium]